MVAAVLLPSVWLLVPSRKGWEELSFRQVSHSLTHSHQPQHGTRHTARGTELQGHVMRVSMVMDGSAVCGN